MGFYSFYNQRIFSHIKNLRGAHFIRRNLKKLALDNVRSIPGSEREGILKEEWDYLVILDACRHDLFQEVVEESDFRYSLGSNSADFIKENFSEGDWSDVVYVTANPHFHEAHFGELTDRRAEEVFHEVFHTYETDWDEEERTIMPEDVVRDAKTAASLFPDIKLIVHFMQPHYPFLESGLEESGIRMVDGKDGETIWGRAEKGQVEDERIWAAYKKNLEIVMEKVRDLQSGLDGKTVITADHGNLVGERGLYGHPGELGLEPLLKVPWHVLNEN